MLRFIGLLLFIPLFAHSQQRETEGAGGVQFVKAINWDDLLRKAKLENKIIFVDCYTTWCGPCKAMDKFVYPSEKVGAFFNKHFISIKLQMDKNSQDDDHTKGWYAEAKEIEKKYSVDAYPTFLFLSPQGKALHRASGGFNEEKLIELGKNALDPLKQSLVAKSRMNVEMMSDKEIKDTALGFRYSNSEFAEELVVEYFNRLKGENISSTENLSFLSQFKKSNGILAIAKVIIDTIISKEDFTKRSIEFIVQFTANTSDKGFEVLYNKPEKMNKVMNAGMDYDYWFAEKFVGWVIYKEEIEPELKDKEPDWQKLSKDITKKYGNYYAKMTILKGKISWHFGRKNFSEYTKHIVLYMDELGGKIESDWHLNQYAWYVFLYSSKTDELNKALSWSNRAILISPTANWMDTYANILYKMGHKQTALKWEENAAKLDPTDKNILKMYEKMKKGEPTWVQSEIKSN